MLRTLWVLEQGVRRAVEGGLTLEEARDRMKSFAATPYCGWHDGAYYWIDGPLEFVKRTEGEA